MPKKNKVTIGEKFNKWTIIGEIKNNQKTRVLVRCDCGNTNNVDYYTIVKGLSVGCRECHYKKNIKHNVATHKLYPTWQGMINRCYKPSARGYRNFGGKGITVIDEWRNSPAEFIKYIESLPNYEKRDKLNLTIDRINVKDDYKKGNLRWATKLEQCVNSGISKNNTSGVKGVYYNGFNYCISVQRNGKRHYRYGFKTIDEAQHALEQLKKFLDSENTNKYKNLL
jgi:hypothetical protein